MNSVVTVLSDTSVMSSSCLEIRESSRSNGPSKLPRVTENVTASGTAGAVSSADDAAWVGSAAVTALGDCATDDQLSSELTVGLRRRVLRGELGDRGGCNR